MEPVTCEFHTGPVTALCVIPKFIVAGCGEYLYLYDTETKECIQRIVAIKCTRIHGIRFNQNDLLCVFGEKKACIIKTHENLLQHTERQTLLPDLIWDSKFLKVKGQLVFALAHNTIVRWDSEGDVTLDVVQCEENSILYCARFITSCWEDLILAAGTVINQVLLWSPASTKTSSGQHKVLQRFKGHQGVIFSIRYNSQRHQLCSVSDDRSIRIWQLLFTKEAAMTTDVDDLELEDWISCQISPLHTLYGHSARVWDINLLSNVMISIGEDSQCCVWNYDGKIVQKFKGHKGKSIWSLASDSKENYFVTGGGDTSIRLWKLNITENQSSNFIHSQVLPIMSGEDFVRTVTFWMTDFVLGMTNEGSLIMYSIQNGTSKVLFADPDFSSYSVLSVRDNVVAIGNIQGTLRLIKNKDIGINKWSDHKLFSGKVFSIHWLSDERILTTGPDGEILCYKTKWNEGNQGLCELCLEQRFSLPYCKQRWISAACVAIDNRRLLCGDRAGTVHVYQWQGAVSDLISNEQMTEPCQSFWKIHGKTGVTDICYTDGIVYTAGRDGHYRTFQFDNESLVLLNTNRVSKGFDWLDKLELRSDGDIYIYGFQSDSFVLFSINSNQKLVQIPCGGGHRAWDCQITGSDKVKFVYLKMRDVILCDTELMTNQVIIKESLHGRETTGVKHLYSCNTDKPVDIVITCSEDTTVLISQLKYNHSGNLILKQLHTLKDHISNVKCMTFHKTDGSHLVFTGGARAQLVITKIFIQKEADSVQKEADLKLTCKTLKSCHLSEEWLTRKQKKLKCFRSDPETRIMGVSVVYGKDVVSGCLDSIYVVGCACSDGFIRILLFNEDTKELIPIGESLYHDHCVLRITHLFIEINHSKHCYFLSGGTDGRIALWDVSAILQTYHKCCKNGIKHKSHTENCDRASATNENCDLQNSESVKVTSTQCIDHTNKLTSGDHCDRDLLTLSLLGQTQSLEPAFAISSHQSGINAISTINLQDGILLIASGGDDNSLCLSVISSKGDKWEVISKIQELSAHAAQITGVQILNKTRVLSASVDQRMCLWEIDYKDNVASKMSLLWVKFISVPDISSMEVWEDEKRYIVGLTGEGLAVYHINKITI